MAGIMEQTWRNKNEKKCFHRRGVQKELLNIAYSVDIRRFQILLENDKKNFNNKRAMLPSLVQSVRILPVKLLRNKIYI